VADRQVARQPGQGSVVENAGHQALVLDHRDHLAVADRHARRLLPPVLQGEQPQVGELGDGLRRPVNGEYATRFAQIVSCHGGGILGGEW
jgi:hypothetical protein